MIVSEEASLLIRNIHGSCCGVLAGSRGPYVGHLYILFVQMPMVQYVNPAWACLIH